MIIRVSFVCIVWKLKMKSVLQFLNPKLSLKHNLNPTSNPYKLIGRVTTAVSKCGYYGLNIASYHVENEVKSKQSEFFVYAIWEFGVAQGIFLQ